MAGVDLILVTPANTTPGNAIDLVLGGVEAAANSTVVISIDLSAPPVLTMLGLSVIGVTITVDLSAPPILAMTLTYDLGVPRGPRLAVGARWQPATPFEVIADGPWTAPTRMPRSFTLPIVDAVPLPDAARSAGWKESHPTRVGARSGWDEAASVRALPTGVPFQQSRSTRTSRSTRWQEAQRRGPPTTTMVFEEARRLRTKLSTGYEEATPLRRQFSSRVHDANGLVRSWVLPWQEGAHPGLGTSVIIPPEPPLDLCYYPPSGDAVDLVLTEHWGGPQDTDLVFVCDNHPPVPPATITVPIREVYMVSNNVSLTLADGTQIPTSNFTLSLDYQSWTWGFTAVVAYSALGLFGFDDTGAPVQVWAHINGEVFKLFVQSSSSTRQFPTGSITLTGLGLISVLDAPYSPTLTFDNAAGPRNAQQIANEVLTDNGVSIGWDVEWNMVDWLVPQNAWSFQGTYATALQAIAAAAGGYLQPHPVDQTARFLPLYPTAPWAWDTVVPDFELPAAVTQTEGITWSALPEYNAVYVSGTNDSGVLAQVKRTGTAGDVEATMVTDQLITHADAARARGLAVLGNTGKQALVSLRLPVLAETGVILPGKFVRYVDGGTTRLGIVRSTSVEVAFPAVWQTIGVETHVS